MLHVTSQLFKRLVSQCIPLEFGPVASLLFSYYTSPNYLAQRDSLISCEQVNKVNNKVMDIVAKRHCVLWPQTH